MSARHAAGVSILALLALVLAGALGYEIARSGSTPNWSDCQADGTSVVCDGEVVL